MQSDAERELKRAFERENVTFDAQRGALASKLGILLVSLFWALDWALVPHLAWRFLLYRLAADGAMATGLLLYRAIGPSIGYGLTIIATGAIAVMLDLMVLHMGGHRSPYYAGLNLLILGVGLVVPSRPRNVIPTCLLIAASYPAVILAFDTIDNVAIFASNCAFIASTTFITVVAATYNHRHRFREFCSREQLAEAHRRLLEIDRLKSQFFANVSHEIRTPLTLNIVPIATLLSGEAGPLTPRQRELLEALDRNALRLRALVTDLLDFSKLEEGRLSLEIEPIDLGAFLSEVADAFGPIFRAKGLALERRLSPGPVFVEADRRKLEKMLANLLGNAFKFTDRGEVAIALSVENDTAVVEISDTGCGIPADALPKLFERFYQVDGTATRRHEGTGIGLSLARELARLHGGDISCRSELGRGSTFTLRLPLAPAGTAPRGGAGGEPSTLHEAVAVLEAGRGADGAARAAAAPAEGAGAGRPKVLLAEDSADLGAYLVQLLRARYEVRWVRTGDEALAVVREWRPDLVLSDVMMPGRDGVAVTSALRQDPDLRPTPVILISARAHKHHVVGGLEGGADDYIVKPFEPDILVSKIEALLRIRRLESELVAAGRLAAIGEVVLALKHEVNNSLTGIIGFADVLLAEGMLAPDSARVLERMKDLAFRIAHVIDRAEHLEEARTIAYLGDRKMIDLGPEAAAASPAKAGTRRASFAPGDGEGLVKPAPSLPGLAPKAPSGR